MSEFHTTARKQTVEERWTSVGNHFQNPFFVATSFDVHLLEIQISIMFMRSSVFWGIMPWIPEGRSPHDH